MSCFVDGYRLIPTIATVEATIGSVFRRRRGNAHRDATCHGAPPGRALGEPTEAWWAQLTAKSETVPKLSIEIKPRGGVCPPLGLIFIDNVSIASLLTISSAHQASGGSPRALPGGQREGVASQRALPRRSEHTAPVGR